MKETVKLVCGLMMDFKVNPCGVIEVNIAENNGSISSGPEDNLCFPNQLHMIISPENIPIFKKLIRQFEAYQRKHPKKQW